MADNDLDSSADLFAGLVGGFDLGSGALRTGAGSINEAATDETSSRDGSAPYNRTSSSTASSPAVAAGAGSQTVGAYFNSLPQAASGWTFQATPPYDSHDTINPFEALQFSPQQISVPLQLHQQNQPSPQSFRPFDVTEGGGNTNSPELVRPHVDPAVMSRLTPAQQEMLKSIAMPSHLQYHSPRSSDSPDSNSGTHEKGTASSPEPAENAKANGRKRKTSADIDEDDEDEEADGHQPVKKTAHNMIEKRYRTNLNDKIAALRDSVPALRIMSKSARGEDTTEDREELQGLTPAHKLNKATVLSKATEYIRHLEKRNMRLTDENSGMKARIAAFEKLFMAGALGGGMSEPLSQPSVPMAFGQDHQSFLNSSVPTSRDADPPGLIQVPDDMKRILAAQHLHAGRPYPIPQQPYQQSPAILRQQQVQQQQQQQAQAGRWNPYLGKLMVGSLAGLMLVEAFTERERSNDTPQGRGLLGVSIPTHYSLGSHYMPASQLIANLKLISLFVIFLWIWVPSVFAPKAPKSQEQKIHATPEAAPSLASPIHVRRKAWLTAIQTVWVPRHNFLLEAAALGLKTLKYTVRNVIGVHGYLWLTGLTEEQEAARVKAWTIALDAQLAGGDVEINKSRLTLTLLASGTLPNTPLRLMMKALHVRVLLWRLDFASGLADTFASNLARALWNEARQLHRILTQLNLGSTDADDELPEHLALLLEQECEHVLNDHVVQRAHNLAWNRPTTLNVSVETDGMNAVVEDPAVRSPMDAVAAWYSSLILHHVLETSLAQTKDEKTGGTSAVLGDELDLAVKLAPIGSNIQVRALVLKAVLIEEKRGSNIAIAIQAMGPSLNPDGDPMYSKALPPLIDSPTTALPPSADAVKALRCAMAIAHLQKFPSPPRPVLILIDEITSTLDDEEMTLLSCTAAFHLMQKLERHAVGREACSEPLERLAGSLRIWFGSEAGGRTGLDEGVRRVVVNRCLSVTKNMIRLDSDQGYGTMSECDEETGDP